MMVQATWDPHADAVFVGLVPGDDLKGALVESFSIYIKRGEFELIAHLDEGGLVAGIEILGASAAMDSDFLQKIPKIDMSGYVERSGLKPSMDIQISRRLEEGKISVKIDLAESPFADRVVVKNFRHCPVVISIGHGKIQSIEFIDASRTFREIFLES
ncbi:hypothetical protein MXD61_09170 [Frankia sp. AgPm24]|uniref:hypothetical protein n=1 Tax=Frankia sp. AgPm24 TaxID=631128 RepID=UPI002010295A|nr:hypothetical protein [Frankia sp. AgPm24]MCK9922051.1 hypothetical protein [Frankia sp. AgPm24]